MHSDALRACDLPLRSRQLRQQPLRAASGDQTPLLLEERRRLCDRCGGFSLSAGELKDFREREDRLREALLSLRRAYREAVILRDVEGLSYEEVAATLQINIGTVKSRIARGRLELRRKLEGSF